MKLLQSHSKQFLHVLFCLSGMSSAAIALISWARCTSGTAAKKETRKENYHHFPHSFRFQLHRLSCSNLALIKASTSQELGVGRGPNFHMINARQAFRVILTRATWLHGQNKQTKISQRARFSRWISVSFGSTFDIPPKYHVNLFCKSLPFRVESPLTRLNRQRVDSTKIIKAVRIFHHSSTWWCAAVVIEARVRNLV